MGSRDTNKQPLLPTHLDLFHPRLEDRRPSIVYEEDIPVNLVRRGSVTMTVRITASEDEEEEDGDGGGAKSDDPPSPSLLGGGGGSFDEAGSLTSCDSRRSSRDSISDGQNKAGAGLGGIPFVEQLSSPSPTPTLIVSSSNNSSRLAKKGTKICLHPHDVSTNSSAKQTLDLYCILQTR